MEFWTARSGKLIFPVAIGAILCSGLSACSDTKPAPKEPESPVHTTLPSDPAEEAAALKLCQNTKNPANVTASQLAQWRSSNTPVYTCSIYPGSDWRALRWTPFNSDDPDKAAVWDRGSAPDEPLPEQCSEQIEPGTQLFFVVKGTVYTGRWVACSWNIVDHP